MRIHNQFYSLMDTADGGDGGGAAVDRGDDFVPTLDDDEVVAAANATAEAERVAAEETAAAALLAEAPPRDETGKFAKKEKDDGPLIPKARFDEQLGKERSAREAAERRTAELEAAVVRNAQTLDIEKSVAEVVALRKQERQAMLDGLEDRAAELSSAADDLNRRIATAEAAALAAQGQGQTLEEMRMEMTIERIEDAYPMLRPGDDAYDEDVVNDILDKQRGLMERERLSPSKALAKAAASIMSRRIESEPTTDPKLGLAAADTRKQEAVAKNLNADKRQPGSLKEVGLASDAAGQTKAIPAAKDLTLAELEALPESTRAKMRGDFL